MVIEPEVDYSIRLIVHPSPVRVAYATAGTLLPQLIATHDPDYVLHIGMAGGRDHYTLETIAHRDNYKIKDIDDRDGWREGEHAWKKENVPECLFVGWDEGDVLKRWEREMYELEDEMGLIDSTPVPTPGGMKLPKGSKVKSVVRLSRDAGRFLCEFALMQSLSRRWVEARKEEQRLGEDLGASSREGKVAFLHVPGGHAADDVVRGVRVAESAIRSLVGSWEAGRRRSDADAAATDAKIAAGRWEGVIWRA
jgi:pyrrolidone-carboxylate peptidase